MSGPISARRRVVVIGGGLAGITAAIALSEAGAAVTLLEARPRLGGATTSFNRGALVVDTGQHVFLRCCTAYRGLLARLGMTGSVRLQDRFDVTVLAPNRTARLRRTGLPGPLHMGTALARYPLISLAQRARVTRAALAMRMLDPADPALDGQRLGDWLAARGQDERTRRVLWDLFTVSSLNIPGDDASLALAATVVKTALLGKRDAADIGVPAAPLGELHGTAGLALLRRLGAEVRLGVKAASVEVAAESSADGGPAESGGQHGPRGRYLIRLARGEGEDAGDGDASGVLRADGVVIATPAQGAAKLVPPQAGVPTGTWAELGTSPIINVHVIYDRRVTRLPFAAAVDSPVQWLFDRTDISGFGASGRGQYLAISQSAADPYVDVPAARLREIFVPALAELLPGAEDARVSEFFVTRERRATFRQGPGCGRLRPEAATALPGLALAGAWTDTGWPDTMEGAVRSGLNAAIELRRGLGDLGGSPLPGAGLRVGAAA
ncbi:MAG TPA: hydroxysqualene dehydroxylase HpnE [Streptosporangiaceae bacterium]|nr:hydroxysqualene dehydroxylase HpnE [Streptosporangiaceae bacterium]